MSLKPNYGYVISQDVRGDTATTSITNDLPNTWTRQDYGSDIELDVPQWAMSYAVKMSVSKLRYDDASAQIYNTDSRLIRVKQNYKYSGRTSFNGQIQLSTNKFINSPDKNSENNILRYTAGVEWSSSGKTVSNIDIGGISVLDGGSERSFGGLYMNMNLTWSRRSYSKFTFALNRDFIPAPQVDQNYYINNALSAAWTHRFGKRFSMRHKVSTNMNQQDDGKSDLFFTLNSGVNFSFSRKFSMSTGIEYKSKKADQYERGFSSMNYSLSVLMQM